MRSPGQIVLARGEIDFSPGPAFYPPVPVGAQVVVVTPYSAPLVGAPATTGQVSVVAGQTSSTQFTLQHDGPGAVTLWLNLEGAIFTT